MVSILDKDVRQQILDATQRVVYERGISAVRTDELARTLGISKKTLYQHFSSKEELLQAMQEMTQARHKSVFQRVLQDPELDFLTRLRKVMQLGWKASSELSAVAAQDMQRHAPRLWASHEQHRNETVLATFRQLLTEGQQLGLLRKDLQMDIVLDMFLSAIVYSLSPNALYEKSYSLKEAHSTFFTLMFEGILTDKARGK